LTISTEGQGTVDEKVLQSKSKDYEHGTVVELTANPAKGWTFVEWKGAVTGSDNPAQVTVGNPKEVTAVFEKKSYALTVNTQGKGAVNEKVVQSKAKDYEHGTTVELTANPADGWKFVEWKGALSGIKNPKRITVDEAKEVTAVFDKEVYHISTSVVGSGTVSVSPNKKTYSYNEEVTFTATADDNYEFI